MALQREFGRFRIERLAVLEFDARPELDGDLLAVGGGLVRQRELRHDVELFIDVEQLVAQRGEHDAADIGARHGRIEHVRILGEADPQRGLGFGLDLGAGRQRHQQGGGRRRQTKHPHRATPHHHACGTVPK